MRKRLLLFLLLLALPCRAQMLQAIVMAQAAASGGGYSDTFPGSALSSNWGCYAGSGYTTPAVASNEAQSLGAASGGTSWKYFCGYTAGSFGTSQHSQATNNAYNSEVYLQETVVCVNMNPSSGNGYCLTGGGSGYIVKVTAGALAYIGPYCSALSNVAVGDVMELTNTSGTLVAYDVTKSTTLCTATDSTYTGGVPGFAFFYTSGYSLTNAISNWSGQ